MLTQNTLADHSTSDRGDVCTLKFNGCIDDFEHKLADLAGCGVEVDLVAAVDGHVEVF
jgi:hypothetical protein